MLYKIDNDKKKEQASSDKKTDAPKNTFEMITPSGNRLMLRKKKISKGLDNFNDYGTLVMFYGRARIYPSTKNKRKYIYFRRISGDLICSMYVSDSVWEYLSDSMAMIMKDVIYDVAFVTVMEQNGQYSNCRLYNYKFLKFKSSVGLVRE